MPILFSLLSIIIGKVNALNLDNQEKSETRK